MSACESAAWMHSPILWPMMENLLHCRAVGVISQTINQVLYLITEQCDCFRLKTQQLCHRRSPASTLQIQNIQLIILC